MSGQNYQLHWSVDMKSWSPDGSVHTGTGENLEASLDLTTLDLDDSSRIYIQVSLLAAP